MRLGSNIFVRVKKGWITQTNIQLKLLNQHIEKILFKMDTLKSAVALMKTSCFFASIDLKDAYFSVSTDEKCGKKISVSVPELYEFGCFPQGYRDSLRVFTKIYNPY